MYALQTLEFSVLDWIQTTLRCPVLDSFFPAFTSLCNHGELWIALSVLLLLMKRHRKAGCCLAVAQITNLVVTNLTLKPLIGRIRPFAVNTAAELLIAMPGDASFPSGHTACSFAAAAALKAAGHPLWKPAALVAVLMGLSRLYLYVHWPSDILGGIFLGLSRSAAAEFSFFMAIPTMLGASALKLLKFLLEGAVPNGTEIMVLIVGSVVSFLVSLAVIKGLMEYVRKHSFSVFGIYRIVLGVAVLAYWLLTR